MKHKGTQLLETNRLILRPFINEDAESMFKNWASDDEVTKFMNWATQHKIEETENTIKSWMSRYVNESFYNWALEDKLTSQNIGFISVVSCDDTVKKAELGFGIGKKWWHKGIMAEALGAVIKYLFGEVGVNRIQACHDTNNPNSGRVMQKCGMKYEGTMRKADINNTGICDISYYAIIAEEYKK